MNALDQTSRTSANGLPGDYSVSPNTYRRPNSRTIASIIILIIVLSQFFVYLHYLPLNGNSNSNNHNTKTYTSGQNSDASNTVGRGNGDTYEQQQSHNNNKQQVLANAKNSIEYYQRLSNHIIDKSSIDSLLEVIYHDLYMAHSPIDMKDHLKLEDSEEHHSRSAQLNHLLHPHKFNDEAALLLLLESNRYRKNPFVLSNNEAMSKEEPKVINVGNEDGTFTIKEQQQESIQALRDKYLEELLSDKNVERVQFLKSFRRYNSKQQSSPSDTAALHISDLLNLDHLNSDKLVDLLHKTRFQRLIMNMYDRRLEAVKRVTNFLYGNETKSTPFELSATTSHIDSGEQCIFFYVYLLAAYPEYRQLYESSDCKGKNKCNFVNKRMAFFYDELITILEPLKTMKTTSEYYKVTIKFNPFYERVMYHIVTFARLWNLILKKLSVFHLDWIDVCFRVETLDVYKKHGSSEFPSVQILKIDNKTHKIISEWTLDITDSNAAIPEAIHQWLKEHFSVPHKE